MGRGTLAASLAVGLSALVASQSASAQLLTFEGVANTAPVANFYNGGAGGNLGISFTTTAVGLVDSDAGGTGNFANEPSPSTTLAFLADSPAFMNVASGFDTGFSFFYSVNTVPSSVAVYDGFSGSGNVLASFNLVNNLSGCSGDPGGVYCAWTPVGASFAGTARSVGFSGNLRFAGFDNITLGSSTPTGAVPEPGTWALMLIGFGAIGASMRRRRRVLAA